MAAVLLVRGTIEYGKLAAFTKSVGVFRELRRKRGWAVPEVLHGLSGPMNSVLLVFRYEQLAAWEAECAAERTDTEYARVASALPYDAGSIRYELFQAQD